MRFSDSPSSEKKSKPKKPGKVTVLVPEGTGGSEKPKAVKSKDKKIVGAAASVSDNHTHKCWPHKLTHCMIMCVIVLGKAVTATVSGYAMNCFVL